MCCQTEFQWQTVASAGFLKDYNPLFLISDEGEILRLRMSLFYAPAVNIFNVPGKDGLLLKNKRKLPDKKEV